MHKLLLLDPRAHLVGIALAVALGSGPAWEAVAGAFPSDDPMLHGGWLCCRFCDRANPPPLPVRWLGGAWSTMAPGRP